MGVDCTATAAGAANGASRSVLALRVFVSLWSDEFSLLSFSPCRIEPRYPRLPPSPTTFAVTRLSAGVPSRPQRSLDFGISDGLSSNFGSFRARSDWILSCVVPKNGTQYRCVLPKGLGLLFMAAAFVFVDEEQVPVSGKWHGQDPASLLEVLSARGCCAPPPPPCSSFSLCLHYPELSSKCSLQTWSAITCAPVP